MSGYWSGVWARFKLLLAGKGPRANVPEPPPFDDTLAGYVAQVLYGAAQAGADRIAFTLTRPDAPVGVGVATFGEPDASSLMDPETGTPQSPVWMVFTRDGRLVNVSGMPPGLWPHWVERIHALTAISDPPDHFLAQTPSGFMRVTPEALARDRVGGALTLDATTLAPGLRVARA